RREHCNRAAHYSVALCLRGNSIALCTATRFSMPSPRQHCLLSRRRLLRFCWAQFTRQSLRGFSIAGLVSASDCCVALCRVFLAQKQGSLRSREKMCLGLQPQLQRVASLARCC